MELSDLRYFYNVARTRSFSRGADLSHITQPAMSKAIRKLEEDVGARLLQRTTRRVFLTPEGELLMARCRRILDEVEGIRADLDAASDVVRGRLRVAAMEVFSIELLPSALAEVVAQHPAIEPTTWEMIPERMETQLREGRLDIGFTIGGGGARGVEYHPLGTSDAVLVCGCSHPLYETGRATAADLIEHPSVVPRFFEREHLPVLDQFPEHIVPRRVGATIELLQMGVQLCVAGAYLGYFPRISVAGHLAQGDLKALDWSGGGEPFVLKALTPAGRTLRTASRLLLDAVRDKIDRSTSDSTPVPARDH